MVRSVGSRHEDPAPAPVRPPTSSAAPRWPRRHPDGPVMVLAHRGGAGPWRENSLEAFSVALALGADGVELDVRRSADGELVVHHDAEVPGSGLIHERRRDQLPAWVPPSRPPWRRAPERSSTSRSRTSPPTPATTPPSGSLSTSPPSSPRPGGTVAGTRHGVVVLARYPGRRRSARHAGCRSGSSCIPPSTPSARWRRPPSSGAWPSIRITRR